MKRYYSIWLKMKRNGVEVAQLYDILAFRDRRARDARLLRHARHGPPALAPGPRPDQGLRRDAQAQLLPVPPHDGDRRDRPALRDPDPDAGDGPDRRARDRGPLEVQGGPARPARRRRPFPVAPAARRLAERGLRPAPVPDLAQGRPLPGRGLHVHAQGRGLRLPARRDADRLRLPGPHRRRAPLRRRAGQRQARAAAHAAPERGHRRDPDGAGPDALARLALLGRHEPRAPQDPALHPRGGEAAGGRARAPASRAGAQEVQAHAQEARRRREPRRGSFRTGAFRGRKTSSPRSATGSSRPETPSSASCRPRSSRGRRPRRRSRPSPASSAGSCRSACPDIVVVGHNDLLAVARQVLQSRAGREDHRLHHPRAGASRCTPRAARTSETSSTTRSARSTWRGRGRSGRPTRSSSRSPPRTGPVCSPT